jgi:hypothetical protein
MDLNGIKKLYLERELTKAELKKREEIAKAMERENPGMGSTPEGMSKKMAIATAQAKKCCEEAEDLQEVSKYDAVVTYYRSLGLDPYKLRGPVGKQIRAKIKASPAFHAWAKINHYESVETPTLYNTIKEIKQDNLKGKKGEVLFFGYPDFNANTSNSDQEQAQTDNNFLTPN